MNTTSYLNVAQLLHFICILYTERERVNTYFDRKVFRFNLNALNQ